MHAVLTAKHYSPRTIRNYTQEMRFLFAHYFDRLPQSIISKDIISYINFIIKEHAVGRENATRWRSPAVSFLSMCSHHPL